MDALEYAIPDCSSIASARRVPVGGGFGIALAIILLGSTLACRVAEWFRHAAGLPDANQRLVEAASNGRYAELRDALAAGADPNAVRYGASALGWAAFSGNIDCVERLIQVGADPSRSGDLQMTPLALATQGKQKDIILLLLKHGARPLEPQEERG